MSYGHSPDGDRESPAGAGPGFGTSPPYPGQAANAGPDGWEPGQQAWPGYGQPGYGQPGYGPPGYGMPPPGPPPSAYRAWGIAAIVCGVLFNLIFGLPTALIGRRHGRRVAGLWACGDVQSAISASRKARNWLIASTVLDVIGLVLFIVIVAQASSSQSNFNNPSAVAASIKSEIQQRISSPSSPYYEPGVTITSVVCTSSSPNTDHCIDSFSNGQTATETAVIGANGASYTTR